MNFSSWAMVEFFYQQGIYIYNPILAPSEFILYCLFCQYFLFKSLPPLNKKNHIFQHWCVHVRLEFEQPVCEGYKCHCLTGFNARVDAHSSRKIFLLKGKKWTFLFMLVGTYLFRKERFYQRQRERERESLLWVVIKCAINICLLKHWAVREIIMNKESFRGKQTVTNNYWYSY